MRKLKNIVVGRCPGATDRGRPEGPRATIRYVHDKNEALRTRLYFRQHTATESTQLKMLDWCIGYGRHQFKQTRVRIPLGTN